MPMMRRGPLDRYPMEWVLRQASAHQTSGSIEFNASRPITVYLRGGRIHHAMRGIPLAGEAPPPAEPSADEAAAREGVVEILATALGAGGGWYYHDPLGDHDGVGPWQWETAALLLDARIRSHEDDSLGSWATTEVALHLPVVPTPVTLGADAWAVVVALAGAATASDVRRRLGWTSDRLVTALEDLGASGALRPETAAATAPDRPRTPDPTVDPSAAAAAVAAAEAVLAHAAVAPEHRQATPVRPATPTDTAPLGSADPRLAADLSDPPARHVGPLAPPPVLAHAGDGGGGDDRRSALRRLISSLRPT